MNELWQCAPPGLGAPFGSGDLVQCVDVRLGADMPLEVRLRSFGLYTVVGVSFRHCCGLGEVRLAGLADSYDPRRFRLVSKPDPDVAAETGDVDEPAPAVAAPERPLEPVAALAGVMGADDVD